MSTINSIATFGGGCNLTYMKRGEKSAFSERLIGAMLAHTEGRKGGTKHGIDTAKLQEVAGVTREMARRYVEGLAIPGPDTMRVISDWLDVRIGWLRDGELPVRTHDNNPGVAEPNAVYLADTETIHDPVVRKNVERLIMAAVEGKLDKDRLAAAIKLLIG